jgi:outer membrane lipoprotein-sorting protein
LGFFEVKLKCGIPDLKTINIVFLKACARVYIPAENAVFIAMNLFMRLWVWTGRFNVTLGIQRQRLKGVLRVTCFFAIVFVCVPCAVSLGQAPAEILQKMQQSYAGVKDYRTDVLVRRYDEVGSVSVLRFNYTFKKSKMIRMDFQSPHEGMVIIYSEQNRKAVVQPFSWAPFVKFHLSPGSDLITGPSGQRIDQTDMGQLIENIGKSLFTERGDKPLVESSETAIEIRVLAEDHFRRNRTTLYRFVIDKARWLPVAVDEWTPDRIRKREIRFQDLQINLGVADSLFKF